LLAELGYEKLDDIIGRTEILKARNIQLAKTQLLDLSYLMADIGFPKLTSSEIRQQEVHSNGPVLDDTLLVDPQVAFTPFLVFFACFLFTGRHVIYNPDTETHKGLNQKKIP
jgi:hypothetical protein